MGKDLKPAVERMTQRMVDHHRKQHKTDVSTADRDRYRKQAEHLARRHEVKNRR